MEFWAFVTSGNLETFKFQGPVIEFNPDYWHFGAQFDSTNAISVAFHEFARTLFKITSAWL